MASSFSLVPVQSLQEARGLQLETWLSIQVMPRCCSIMLKIVNEGFPIHGHLQRVKKEGDDLHLLLCPQHAVESIDNLQKDILDHTGFAEQLPIVRDVPACGAYYLDDVKLWSQQYWPMYRRLVPLDTPVVASLSPSDLACLEKYSRMVASLGDHACIIVDPTCDSIKAQCISQEHPVMDAAREMGQVLQRGSDPSQLYCTGYTVYLTHEPCVMCSMALVHSRAARVVYTRACPAVGGLGSMYRIHANQKLNHHFHVYRANLE